MLRKEFVYALALVVLSVLALIAFNQESPQSPTGMPVEQTPTGLSTYQPPLQQPSGEIDMLEYYTTTIDLGEAPLHQEFNVYVPPGPQFEILAVNNVAACFTASGIGGIAAGDVINLTANITQVAGTCVALDFPDVALECNGNIISGNGGAGTGIAITARNVTVQNCTVHNFTGASNDGISITAANVTIYNTTSRFNADDGIDISGVPNATIRLSLSHNNSGEGLVITGAASRDINISNSTFMNNTNTEVTISSAGTGIHLINNTFNHTETTASVLVNIQNTNDIVVFGNTFGGYNKTGTDSAVMNITSSSGATTRNATVGNNSFVGPYDISLANAVHVRNYTNVLIENNSAPVAGDISVQFGNNVTVHNNTLFESIFVRGQLFPNIDITNVTISQNSWIADRDNLTTSQFAITSSAGSNFTIRDHSNITMRANCGQCDNFFYINNNHTNNARVSTTGVNVTVYNNRFVDLYPDGTNSAGINWQSGFGGFESVNISNNLFENGTMYSIDASLNDNVFIYNNTFNNITGRGITVDAANVSVYNNTFTDFSGTAIFFTESSNSRIEDNSISFTIRTQNTTFNYAGVNATTLNSSGVGIYFAGTLSNFNVSRNTITVSNPGLDNNIHGILQTNQYGARGQGNADFDGNVIGTNLRIDFNTITTTGIGIYLDNATRSNISRNSLTNIRRRALTIERGTFNTVGENTITAPAAIPAIGLYERGITLYRTVRNNITFNNVSEYAIGLFIQNASRNNITNITLANIRDYGVFSFAGRDNLIQNVSTTSTVNISISLLQTNTTNITNSSLRSRSIGAEFYQSYRNNITESAQNGGGTATYGFVFDLFSSHNGIDTNTFAGNTIADILFDMFATNNTGSGNGGPSTASENGASGNTVT